MTSDIEVSVLPAACELKYHIMPRYTCHYPSRGLPLPVFSVYTVSLDTIDMSGSAVADIRDTYGVTFIGLFVSAVSVFSLSYPHPLADLVNS